MRKNHRLRAAMLVPLIALALAASVACNGPKASQSSQGALQVAGRPNLNRLPVVPEAGLRLPSVLHASNVPSATIDAIRTRLGESVRLPDESVAGSIVRGVLLQPQKAAAILYPGDAEMYVYTGLNQAELADLSTKTVDAMEAQAVKYVDGSTHFTLVHAGNATIVVGRGGEYEKQGKLYFMPATVVVQVGDTQYQFSSTQMTSTRLLEIARTILE